MLHNIESDKLEQIRSQNNETRQLIDDLLENHKNIISTITHEIRNPLALIYSSLQIIESKHPEVHTYEHWAETISDVEYIALLLNDLSTINRGYIPHMQRVNFQDFLRQCTISFAASLTESPIEFTSKIADDIPDLMCDKVKLQESIFNILNNASDALENTKEEHPAIKFKAVYNDKKELIEITISDNGCGITPENLTTIFKPFCSFKSSGTGLGLTITQMAIERHNGTITVKSTLGKGTRFIIKLPAPVIK